MRGFHDPLMLPQRGENAAECWAHAQALAGTAGAAYVERRGVPLNVAEAAGVRFDADFGGRPAVLAPLSGALGELVALHGRYLEVRRGQDKMLTLGPGGGLITVLDGWQGEPLIVVEGLFDALSLATCGWSAVATIGRWAPWLPRVASGRAVWLAFDACRPGEADVARYARSLPEAEVHRLPPPPHSKDWSSALIKHGRRQVAHWLQQRLTHREGSQP